MTIKSTKGAIPPSISSDEIWRSLTTSEIGFYTSLTSPRIPVGAGVYAWLLPLQIREGPEQLLRIARRIFAYDPKAKSIGRIAHDSGFTWDPQLVTVQRDPTVNTSPKRLDQWTAIERSGQGAVIAFRQALLVGSVFARPLYIGLTNELKRRYQEHADGKVSGNTFNQRFTSYMDDLVKSGHLNFTLSVRQLVFACIPVPEEGDAINSFAPEQIALLEDLLKILCQPVFGER